MLAKPNKNEIDQNQMLSQSKHGVEFLIVGCCKSFDFNDPKLAAHFLAEFNQVQPDGTSVATSDYMACLQDITNFQKINNFLSQFETNVKYLIQLLEQENDISMYIGKKQKSRQFVDCLSESQSDLQIPSSPDKPSAESSSLYIILNLLTLGLSKSVDERIVQ